MPSQVSCGSPTAFTGLWFHGHLAGSAQTVTHLPARRSKASQRQSIAVTGFISQHTGSCPPPCLQSLLGRDPDPEGCTRVIPNTTPREVAGRLCDATPAQLLAVLCTPSATPARCQMHPGETSLGTPLDTVHADTNILRGEGGPCSTAPVFGVCQ